MNGIHDMGGMDGFGAIVREQDEPVFHSEWEKRVFAMLIGAKIGAAIRPAIEQMDPTEYLATSYYEKWLHARIETLVDVGAITREELDARIALLEENPEAEFAGQQDPEHVAKVLAGTFNARSPLVQTTIKPAFAVGDRVRVRNLHPVGHTRLPRYARGKIGLVTNFYGVHLLQDARPANTKPPPEPIYAVRFAAKGLWGDSASARDFVHLDLWESYLEPNVVGVGEQQ